MTRLSQLKLITFALVFYLHAGYAQDAAVLPALDVTAQPDDQQNAAFGVDVMDQKDLTKMQYRSISDILQASPSYQFSSLGGMGQNGITFMRGAGGQGIMTLDDIPLLPFSVGSHITDTLPGEAIERAEIRRGPSEAYHAFQALGGAIRLYTHDRDSTGGKLSVEGGSFGLLRETLQAGLAGKAGRATMTLTRADAFDGTHYANAYNNKENDMFRFTQGIFRFSSDLTGKTKWEGSMLYRKSTTGIDKFGVDSSGLIVSQDDANSYAHQETWLAQNKLTQQLTDRWQTQLQLGYTQSNTFVNAGQGQNAVSSRLYLVNWRNRHLLLDERESDHHLQFFWGAQGRYEEGQSPLENLGGHRTSAAGFTSMDYHYKSIFAEAGVRLENFDNYGLHPLFQTGVSWQIRPELTLRVSGGTGFRLPSYSELFYLIAGNRALKPERSASVQAGLEWRPVTGLQLGANGFYHHYQDLISYAYNPILDFTPASQNSAYDPHPGFAQISANIASARAIGTELTGQYNWGKGLDSGFSYTFSDNRNLATNRLLPFKPRHSAKFWQEWRLSSWPITLRAEMFYSNSAWNDFNNRFPVKDRVQINASLRYRVNPNFDVYLRGENLSDNRHAQRLGFDMPGAAVYGGINISFK